MFTDAFASLSLLALAAAALLLAPAGVAAHDCAQNDDMPLDGLFVLSFLAVAFYVVVFVVFVWCIVALPVLFALEAGDKWQERRRRRSGRHVRWADKP